MYQYQGHNCLCYIKSWYWLDTFELFFINHIPYKHIIIPTSEKITFVTNGYIKLYNVYCAVDTQVKMM